MLLSGKITIEELNLHNYSPSYICWLNDYQITKFLETKSLSKNEIEAFIKNCSDSTTEFLFGIFYEGCHVGNVKLGQVDYRHKFGEIGLLVGEKKFHGKGIGSEALWLCCDFAKKKLGLHKVLGGMHEPNLASYKTFLKCGFREVGRFQQHRLVDGIWYNNIIMEKIL